MPISTIQTSEVDVLIIGAGPAGLMACNALSRAGINVRIVDKRPRKVAAGQADGIQPRTIEVLQSYGLADRLLAEANQLHQVATLHQGAIEDIFLDSMKGMGVEVSRPIVPTSIQISETEEDLSDPEAYPVRVVLKRLDALEGQTDTEIVHAKYVIGGDGAHSWVRKTFDIDMEGEQTDYVWGVVDLVPETDFPDIRNRCAIHSNNGSCMIIPREDDKVRLYIQLGSRDAVDATNGRVAKDQMSPEKLLEVARKSMAPYTIKEPKEIEWWTIYRIGQRVAARYSVKDRVFIAGDACHTHSPKAVPHRKPLTAWKLVHVIRGWADASLLKTYELERRKYAQDLISFDKQFAKMFSNKVNATDCHDGVSAEEFTNAFHKFGGFSSGLGICYQESIIVRPRHQEIATGLILGKRVPAQTLVRAADGRQFELQNLLPSDTRFKILVFTGDISEAEQKDKVNKLALDMGANDGFLKQYSPHGVISTAFDILSIASSTDNVNYTDFHSLFRSHWSKVYIDGQVRASGGDAYIKYGVASTGAVVVVRPDGYVGAMAPFDKLDDLNRYFKDIMSTKSL
ncbi:hypothetical protein H0H92_005841 [Tricholoma furcatifolium]|nr:hypothetical protein H0H92_005841 [Tricholoma furcatifolium]